LAYFEQLEGKSPLIFPIYAHIFKLDGKSPLIILRTRAKKCHRQNKKEGKAL
jgi:hypothetical protein